MLGVSALNQDMSFLIQDESKSPQAIQTAR